MRSWTWTHQLDVLDTRSEVPHEGEGPDPLGDPWDLTEVDHEALLLAQLVQRPALGLEVLDQFHLVVRGDEALQELQEVQTQRLQVVPAWWSRGRS